MLLLDAIELIFRHSGYRGNAHGLREQANKTVTILQQKPSQLFQNFSIIACASQSSAVAQS